MGNELYFQINHPKVVHEILDDEVIIVNLDSGIYYSIDSSSVWAWQAMLAGYSLAGMVALGVGKFEAPDEEIADALTAFWDKLQTEGIVVAGNAQPQSTESLPLARPGSPKIPFTYPTLELYTDMQNLLLLDPIHDVDDSGWPNAKNE